MTQNNSNSFTLQFPSAEYLTNRIINWGYNNTPEAVSEYVNEQLANFEKKMKEKAINVQFILNEMKMVNLQRDQYRVIDAILGRERSGDIAVVKFNYLLERLVKKLTRWHYIEGTMDVDMPYNFQITNENLEEQFPKIKYK